MVVRANVGAPMRSHGGGIEAMNASHDALRFYPGPTEQRFVGCTQFKTKTPEFNCRSPESYLAFAPWQIAITGMTK